MTAARIFIDGEAGTTGLQIRERLIGRDDIELLSLGEDRRKDKEARAGMLNAADVAILCLPDDAARESVSLITNGTTRVIDASTAHRISEGWTYGFPEYDAGQPEVIASAKRVANTGCYAVASVALLYPLVKAGVMAPDHAVAINAVSGYSGGGKKLIRAFQDKNAPDHIAAAVRTYALGLNHKHLPEIQRYGGLDFAPVFVPSVAGYMQGMVVQIPLALRTLNGAPSAEDLHRVLAGHYQGRRFVSAAPLKESLGMGHIEPEGLNGTNHLRLFVFANPENGVAVLCALLDNLGKGASGQAVQCLNLMIGADEGAGLDTARADYELAG